MGYSSLNRYRSVKLQRSQWLWLLQDLGRDADDWQASASYTEKRNPPASYGRSLTLKCSLEESGGEIRGDDPLRTSLIQYLKRRRVEITPNASKKVEIRDLLEKIERLLNRLTFTTGYR